MMSDMFDDLKKSWQKSKAMPSLDDARYRELLERAREGYRSYRRKLLRETIMVTVSFIITFAFFIWIWLSFPDQSAWFYSGIIAISAIMVVYNTLFWLTIRSEKKESTLETRQFVEDVIKRLRLRLRIMRVGVPVYTVLLAVGLSLYYVDFADRFNWWQNLLLFGVTYVYVFGVTWFFYRKKEKERNSVKNQITDWEALLPHSDEN